MTLGRIHLFVKSLYYIKLFHNMCFKDRIWFGLCHFQVIAHVIFVHAVPVPGDNITPPLYKSTKSCESLLQAEWQQIISGSFHTAKYF